MIGHVKFLGGLGLLALSATLVLGQRGKPDPAASLSSRSATEELVADSKEDSGGPRISEEDVGAIGAIVDAIREEEEEAAGVGPWSLLAARPGKRDPMQVFTPRLGRGDATVDRAPEVEESTEFERMPLAVGGPRSAGDRDDVERRVPTFSPRLGRSRSTRMGHRLRYLLRRP
ncbi:uncharacterized protein LOC105702651 [Orussus abietinus]|uniref:uncharacterized protein LOC105702651 n=1 Tax=Orussus abietinus TaxID=222816 RepID=UPI0006262DB6|nr:uncharacterized protein LOC105702651 [Orussus abietinus]